MDIIEKTIKNITGKEAKGDIITEQMDKAKSKKVATTPEDIVENIN